VGAPESGEKRGREREALSLDRFDVLSFDCYGTLIDWEAGLLAALRPILDAHGAKIGDEPLLEAFARHETRLESGAYLPYREVLAGALRGIAAELGFEPSAAELRALAESVGEWPPFEDSAPALASLGERFRLAVITNCDEDLFARSAERLGADFSWVVTAERARSYKPSPRSFELAIETIGLPRERILHVAQSLFHDHAPAKQLGLTTVWVDRRSGKPGSGATPPAQIEPDLTLSDLRSLAELAA
jgi:2-haloacid dehalogenase